MRLILNSQAAVAAWSWKAADCRPMQYEFIAGIAAESGQLVGAIMFTNYNGHDVEVHFYGPGRLTRRAVRFIMQTAIMLFNVERLTVRTRKPHMARGVAKLGAIYEGTMRRLYGPTDADEHAGQQFAFYRPTIMKLAGIKDA